MDYVKLKGIKNGLKAVISNAARYEDVQKELDAKLSAAIELFKTKKEHVMIIEGGLLTHDQKCEMQCSIFKILGTKVLVRFEEPQKEVSQLSPCLFHSGTVRSGQNIASDGHLVVLGDVNPGAEVSANGNVIVLGALRGLVHAGAGGDRNALVIALGLSPTQIRIADIITRAPDDNPAVVFEPEIACVRDNKIYIDVVIKH